MLGVECSRVEWRSYGTVRIFRVTARMERRGMKNMHSGSYPFSSGHEYFKGRRCRAQGAQGAEAMAARREPCDR